MKSVDAVLFGLLITHLRKAQGRKQKDVAKDARMNVSSLGSTKLTPASTLTSVDIGRFDMKKPKTPKRRNVFALHLRLRGGAGKHNNRTKRATQVARVRKHKGVR